MNSSNRLIGSGLLAFTCSFCANAKQDASLSEVLVESPSSNKSTQPLQQASEFNRSDLDAADKADLNGMLRSLAGVNIAQSNTATPSTLQVRAVSGGLGMVTLDGVPLFNSFVGFFPLSHYPLDFFDGVTVDRGLNSERDSSRTIGGAINLSSRQIESGRGFLHTEGGSYGTLRNHLGTGISGDLGNLTMIGGRSDIFESVSQAGPANDGSERDNFGMSNGLLRWNRELSRGNLDSSLYFARSHEGWDGPGRLADAKFGWTDDLNGAVDHEIWVTQTHGSYQIANNWESSLKIGFTQDQQTGRIGSLPSGPLPMNLNSQLLLGRWQNTHTVAINPQSTDALRWIWGIESQQQSGHSPFNPYKVFELNNHLLSPLVRGEIDWGRWLANVELRFDHYQNYGDHPVLNASTGWRLNPDMLIWAKAGNAYRIPAVNELLHPVFGNPNLLPEKSLGGEVGWRFKDKHDDVSVTAYMQFYDNIIYLEQSVSKGTIRAANLPEAEVFGVEIQGKHAWNQVLSSGISYTYMNSRSYNNAIPSGFSSPQRPPHQGQFWSEWRLLEPVRFRLDMTFRDGYWVDSEHTVKIGSAPRLNASINYQVSPTLRLNVRGENINNQLTPDLYGFNYVGAAVYGGAYLDW